jgi:hypothetical protein
VKEEITKVIPLRIEFDQFVKKFKNEKAQP